LTPPDAHNPSRGSSYGDRPSVEPRLLHCPQAYYRSGFFCYSSCAEARSWQHQLNPIAVAALLPTPLLHFVQREIRYVFHRGIGSCMIAKYIAGASNQSTVCTGTASRLQISQRLCTLRSWYELSTTTHILQNKGMP
jgi:hypothetical protein